ncbi:sigma factor-like helix-turn-helix DNA-binding protein [Allosphingosinicella humi]
MSIHDDGARSDDTGNRGALRQRAVSALQRSLARRRSIRLSNRRTTPARVARVEAAICSLPPLTREVFILHRFDELGYERIAHRLGISVEDVTSHIAAAILQLDRALRDSDMV